MVGLLLLCAVIAIVTGAIFSTQACSKGEKHRASWLDDQTGFEKILLVAYFLIDRLWIFF